MRVFITGVAHLGAAGRNTEELLQALERGERGISPLTLFPLSSLGEAPRPVAQVPDFIHDPELPRTHALARAAAAQLSLAAPPDAVVLGGTTGGMPLSEVLLEAGASEPHRYALHGTGTVAQHLARELGCTGMALTVSTACSSGAVALKVAAELIRHGLCRTVVAGGVDALCRLTYHGFRLLKLIDPAGARPLDRDRRGMSVGEAAALLLLTGAGSSAPKGALAELRGVGASCDAHHPTMPLPGGEGAVIAMERALADAGLSPGDLDYINLHGTGTAGNDASEAAAVRALYSTMSPPTLSSTKGITGHPLAAAGAVEAVACTLCLERGLLPGNAGLEQLDLDLGISPLELSRAGQPRAMLSNSFGFGGNNAAVVLTSPGHPDSTAPSAEPGSLTLQVLAAQCISGAGGIEQTLAALDSGGPAMGSIPDATLKEGLPLRLIRRLKRLPRMALALAHGLVGGLLPEELPRSVFFATGWGPLSETHDFLQELMESDEDLSSPTDFVGSVHNAPAGQLAQRYKAQGANVTATGGDTSFEQALLMAALMAEPEDEPLLLMGADEHHPRFTPLLDLSAPPGTAPAEGGGVLLVRRPTPRPNGDEIWIRPLHLALAGGEFPGQAEGLPRFSRCLIGAPAGYDDLVQEQLHALERNRNWEGEPLYYRTTLGQHASASAQATALAVNLVQQRRESSVLLIMLGEVLAATAVWRGASGHLD